MRHVWSILLIVGTAPAQDLFQLVADLDHKDRKKSAAAYRALAKDKPKRALQLLFLQLPKHGFTGQNYGMLLLEKTYTGKVRRKGLGKFAKSDSRFLAACSATILFREGNSKVLPQLVGAMRAQKVSVTERITMVKRVQGITNPEVLAAIRENLTPGVNRRLLTAVLDSMWRTQDSQGIGIVEKLLRHRKTTVSAQGLCAAYLVARGGHVHGPALAKILADAQAISTSIRTYVERIRRPTHVVLDGLTAHVRKTKKILSMRWALDFLRKNHHRNLLPLLRETTLRKNETIARTALAILAQNPEDLPPKDLRKMLASEKPIVALFAAKQLRRRDDLSGFPRALELAKREDKDMDKYRVEAVKVLGGYREDRAVQPLIDLLKNKNASVRSTAVKQLNYVLADLFPYRRFDFSKTGYTATGSAMKRRAGIETIQKWWDDNKD
jgi:hypothetical protein